MDDNDSDREKECCSRCRWTEVRAQPFGAVDYLCGRRQEAITSSVAAKRSCSEFEP